MFYRRAEEDIITGTVTVVFRFQNAVDHAVLQCGGKRFLVSGVCKDMIIRMKFPDGFCDRTSDQAKPDKSDGFHINKLPFH